MANVQPPERPPERPPLPGEGQAAPTRARSFPCASCGADLAFSPGQQQLACPYCGHVEPLVPAEDAEIVEQDLETTLARLLEQREAGREVASGPDSVQEVPCQDCGAVVQFVGTMIAQRCAYCGSPLQLTSVHEAKARVRVDAVLPFQIEEQQARVQLDAWVRGRWFLPNDLKGKRIGDRFQGVYLPFWTFDALTTNAYRGERGEHYWVTVGTGKNQRRERRTRWYPASGRFERFFDDVLVFAGRGLPTSYVDKLEPWPLVGLQPWNPRFLAGHFARTYDLELDGGFRQAKQRMEQAIEREVRQRIGGDTQRVHSIQSHFGALTFKHLLLPLYLLTYRYRDKSYQVVVNAATGEVQGQRPYSWIKITLLVLVVLALGFGIWWLVDGRAR